MFSDSPPFNNQSQTSASQSRQFGYNIDFIGLFPLPAYDVPNSRHGLIACNHEYTNPELMFPGYTSTASQTQDQTKIELAAHGCSVVEVRGNADGRWESVQGSRYNRRLTATSEFQISGPAAGHDMMKTAQDPTGRLVLGTLNNCAGGKTPWGTYLTAEENFYQYFSNATTNDPALQAHFTRYGMPAAAGDYPWARFNSRLDAIREPNESNRFGWIVEFDPYNPGSIPKKRTALGRFRHEACMLAVNRDGRVVAYSGDDERFHYAYKFVSKGQFNAFTREANFELLDEGTLYVAKFSADGTGEWLPMVQGQGPLTAANGFTNQGDVVIKARQAG